MAVALLAVVAVAAIGFAVSNTRKTGKPMGLVFHAAAVTA